MKLTLVRHGETEENVQGVIQGQQPGHLSGRGKQQAVELAGMLKGLRFDAIYCSDLQRCLDTAEPIRWVMPYVPFFTDILLRERSGGSLEGQSLSLVEVHKTIGDWYTYKMPGGGESWEDARTRQVTFLNKVFELYPEGSILIISHGGPVRGMRSLLEGKTLAEVDAEGTPNAGIWELVMTELVHE